MTWLLAGDIGGTKTILRLVKQTPDGDLNATAEEVYPSRQYRDLVPIVHKFLQSVRTESTESNVAPTPEAACFAIAGPVVPMGDTQKSTLTNLQWELTGDRLQQELGIGTVELINDFAAIGYGVLGLTDDDVHALQALPSHSDAPIAVIGAGTGLGEGFLIPHGDTYQVFPSEGGHADFAPRSQLEDWLREDIQSRYNIRRVSVERVVSGQGIIAIYRFLLERSQQPGKAADLLELKDPAAAISAIALGKQQSDRATSDLCRQTMRLFISTYGSEAGNLALKLLPYGGLYIAGGIAAKIIPLLENDNRFMDAFLDKGRVRPLLENVPVYIITNPKVGLLGAAIRAAQLF